MTIPAVREFFRWPSTLINNLFLCLKLLLLTLPNFVK